MSETSAQDATTPVGEGDGPTMEPESFVVSVKGQGVELTRGVDQATALSVISAVLGGGAPVAQPPAQHAAAYPAGQASPPGAVNSGIVTDIDPDITIGEYIDECEAQKFPEKITAIGNFLQKRLGQEYFTRDEVKSQFPQAGEALPGNFSRDFTDAVSKKWIAETTEKGHYLVTKTGRSAIEARFDKTTRRSVPTRRRRTAKADAGVEVPAVLQDLDE